MSEASKTRKQHFLPRLLLNGFLSRGSGKQSRAWYFRKDTNPVETNIVNIAAARDFHGRDGIEEKLANEEGEYATLLTGLRTGRVSPEHAALIAPFVSHLIVRTKHLRDGLEEMMQIGLPAILDAFVDPANIGDLRELFLAELQQRLPREQLLLVTPQIDALIAQMQQQFRAERERRGDPLVSATPSQLKALAGSVDAIPRTEVLQQLIWMVAQFTGDEDALILGDIGPIARGDGSDNLESPLMFNTTVPSVVYLPVSSDTLLVGQRAPAPIDPLEDINRAMAELSREFFVARRNGDREAVYHRLLGSRSQFMEPDEIRRLAQNPFRSGSES